MVSRYSIRPETFGHAVGGTGKPERTCGEKLDCKNGHPQVALGNERNVIRAATVYRRRDAIYVHSLSRTTDGVWIAAPPFLRLELDSADFDKGEAELQALQASRDEVPHPTDWGGVFTPMQKLAEVPSWAIFSRHAQCLHLEQEALLLSIEPQQNLGAKKGFQPLISKVIQLATNAGPKEIGAALERAFDRCS